MSIIYGPLEKKGRVLLIHGADHLCFTDAAWKCYGKLLNVHFSKRPKGIFHCYEDHIRSISGSQKKIDCTAIARTNPDLIHMVITHGHDILEWAGACQIVEVPSKVQFYIEQSFHSNCDSQGYSNTSCSERVILMKDGWIKPINSNDVRTII